MNKAEFVEALVNALQEEVPEAKITVKTFVKAGDRELTGILPELPGQEICPTLYADPYYGLVESGQMTVDEAIGQFIDTYRQNADGGREIPGFSAEDFMNWEKVKEHIVPRLLSRKLNARFLEDVPSSPTMFGDLVEVYAYLLTTADEGMASIVIHNCHVKKWGVTIDDLHQAAMANAPRLLPPVVKTMKEMLQDMMPAGMEGEMLPPDMPEQWVISNAAKTYGAAVALYADDILDELAHKNGGQVAILPSSVNELIAMPVPVDERTSLPKAMKVLSDMVKEVNETQVPDGEILSDHAYLYREGQGIVILDGQLQTSAVA